MSEPQHSIATRYAEAPLEQKQSWLVRKPPLQPKHVWAIRRRLQLDGRHRDLALLDLAVDRKLSARDLARLCLKNVVPPRPSPHPPALIPIGAATHSPAITTIDSFIDLLERVTF